VKKSARRNEREYLEAPASKAEAAADCQNLKELFDLSRKVIGVKKNDIPVRRKDGNIRVPASVKYQMCR
jgi:hypothetical protein